MNDALEFKPPIKGVASRGRLEQTILERFEARFPGRIQYLKTILPHEEAERLVSESVSKTAYLAEANLEQTVSTIYRINDENFGILSLSEDLTSTLMWAHYADGGRGS